MPSHPLPWQMSLDKILISKYITNIHLSITHPNTFLVFGQVNVLQPSLRHTIVYVFASPPEHLLPLRVTLQLILAS
jgi:hypothetical protein